MSATSERETPATEAPRRSFAVRALSALVRGYQLGLSPLIGPRCRFDPTCSAYALEALATHGALRGGWLTVRRLCRCHPFGGSGWDPVPMRPGAAGEHQQRSDDRAP